ncbi:hypothetical protein [Actinoplanes derwentensis]|uniref:ABC-2 type transport system permease protein n=1 Tax=Actinoplanes derwentensis TaxID=113562 RepID=A0A1H2CC26_9ACTN|nr:hypothetical protein [Actinoplanes derwentensis]GID87314.1 hypothetical protein Ade03nite_62380 [Actinoplanes derwentensis]SDT68105.1 hypothetical protein SAMN04489716_5573 [Actinoplanes derwentensis]
MRLASRPLRFAAFLIRVQWIDRRATSSFLIGITLQTGILTLALTDQATDPSHALELACRAALLTGIGIALLSAMSSIHNEFRYGTMENVLLGRMSLSKLLAVRAAACAVVMSPAIVVPFVGAMTIFPALVSARTAVLIGMVYGFLAVVGHQTTLLLSQFARPAAAVPWIRLLLLIVGISILPFPGAQPAALALPPGWILRYADEAGSPGTPESLTTLAMFVLILVGWSVALGLTLRRRVGTKIEQRLVDGRAEW